MIILNKPINIQKDALKTKKMKINKSDVFKFQEVFQMNQKKKEMEG